MCERIVNATEASSEPDYSGELWFDVVIGACNFAVRAAMEASAAEKAQMHAEELRKPPFQLETNGFPLVMPLSQTDSAWFEAKWQRGKADTTITAIRQHTPIVPKQHIQPDHNQPSLF